MWSPINIAKVGAVEKESTSPSPPPPPEHTTPSSVAKTSENGQVFETGNAISPPSLGGDPGKREGVAAGKSEETNDATSGRRVREGGAQDPSMTEQAPSATHQAVTRDKDLIVGKAVDGTGESMHVPLQVAASKSERR